jgi:hypothetical protein
VPASTPRFVRRAVSLVLSISLAASSLPAATSSATTQTRTPAQREDGEALFRAIFFQTGPLADEIPELRRVKSIEGVRRLTPQQANAVHVFQSRLVQELRAARPTFFQDFERQLRSGDRARISRALAEAAQLSKQVLEKNDPEAAKFIRRHEAGVRRGLSSAARSAPQAGPPDLKALQRALPEEAVRDAERLELTWLKGVTVGETAASDQKPDTDHSVAVVLYTLVLLVVAVVKFAFIPVISADVGGSLYNEQLVDSLASRLGGR